MLLKWKQFRNLNYSLGRSVVWNCYNVDLIYFTLTSKTLNVRSGCSLLQRQVTEHCQYFWDSLEPQSWTTNFLNHEICLSGLQLIFLILNHLAVLFVFRFYPQVYESWKNSLTFHTLGPGSEEDPIPLWKSLKLLGGEFLSPTSAPFQKWHLKPTVMKMIFSAPHFFLYFFFSFFTF